MKKNIKIEKQFDFSTMIGEVCAISLEPHLLFVQEDLIRGDLVISGRYKSTVASQIEEDFQFSIPVEITILENIDSSTANIDIVDFYYQLNESRLLSCVIEIQIEATEILTDERECDGETVDEKEIEVPIKNPMKEYDIKESNALAEENREETDMDGEDNSAETNEDVNDDPMLFNIDLTNESYGTFIVYMVRQNESINSILEKYHTSLEEVEKYNDLKNISMGSKLIIPLIKDEN